jgi:N-acetylglucosaminyl-diphospho-decaprenol L-rhamnosyltransferase
METIPAANALGVVVVHYESGPLLEACIRSLRADAGAGPIELVVVDNGSSDGSVDTLLRAFPDVQVIRAPGNVGYARGANLGIAATRADAVVVLNSDTRVEPGSLRALSDRLAREPRLGACGPRMKNDDGSDYPSARQLPGTRVAVMHGLLGLWWPQNRYTARYRQLDAPADRARAVDWVSGGAMWLRRAALDDIGGWDERYFMYLEDVDLCWQLRRAGWDIAYEPAGVVWHTQGASTRRHPYRMLAAHHHSAWLFAKRRYTGMRAFLLPFAAVYLTARAALAMAQHAVGDRRASGRGD